MSGLDWSRIDQPRFDRVVDTILGRFTVTAASRQRVGAVTRALTTPLTTPTVPFNGLEILRRVTTVNGGTAYPLYAPMIAVNAASADAHRQQPGVKTTMKRYRHVTKAVVYIGSWTPSVSQVYDVMTRPERHALLEAGAVAETCALLFDRDGRPVKGLMIEGFGIPPSRICRRCQTSSL